MTNTPRDAAKDKRTNNEAEAFIDLAEALDMWLENRLQAVHTCIPGYIESYDKVNRRCDVTPSINLPFPGGEFLQPPKILSAPVLIPGSSEYMTDFDIPNGTTCIVQFSEVGIGQWLQGAKQPDADNPARFKLTDAMVTPGLFQYGKVPTIKNGVKQKGDNVTHTAKGTHAIEAKEVNFNKGSKGVARKDDATIINVSTDSAFVTWLALVDTFIKACTSPVNMAAASVVYLAAQPAPLTKADGKITEASDSVKAGN
ncbi:MAG: hypothetical protein KAR06_02135 [Deltaproteobacteria bacterium]|nr:hypothetical protein [Deltaproteobacteria bacterium]